MDYDFSSSGESEEDSEMEGSAYSLSDDEDPIFYYGMEDEDDHDGGTGDGVVDGAADGFADGVADGAADGGADGVADGAADANGVTNGNNVFGSQRVLCFGAGRSGSLSMLVLARHWQNLRFYIVDTNVELIQKWNSGTLPFDEPGLIDLVNALRGHNVFFRSTINAEMLQANLIFIAVDIPIKKKGLGADCVMDLTNLERAYQSIATYSTVDKFIVEKSTLPVGPRGKAEALLSKNRNGCNFHIAYNPDFFAQGSAIDDLENPSLVLVAMKTRTGDVEVVRSMYLQWIPPAQVINVNSLDTLELAKVALNAVWASQVSLMSAFSTLCERVDGDIRDVTRIIRADKRINFNFYDSGVGFGGPGLTKDVKYLTFLADYKGLKNEARLFRTILKINVEKRKLFVTTMRDEMMTLKNKIIAICGLTYKVGTDDLRDSAAIDICARLLKKEGARVKVFDPCVSEEKIRGYLPRQANLRVCSSMPAAWLGAHAICFLVKWETLEMDLRQQATNIFAGMEKPGHVFDACLFESLPVEELRDAGLHLHMVGVYNLG